MIADILLINQKQSIIDFETINKTQNPNLNLELRSLNRIHYKSEKPELKI